MQLIKFSNGKWGIRRLSIGDYEYMDFRCKTTIMWWRKDNSNFRDCQTEEPAAREMFRYMFKETPKIDYSTITDEVIEP